MGVVSTAALLLYGLMGESGEDIFWSLFAFSAAIFLIPYIILVLAFLRMRYVDAARHRPFRVPGGNGVAVLFAAVCGGILAFALFLFVYTPGQGFNWSILGGVVTVVALGELLIRWAEAMRGAPETDRQPAYSRPS